ncbi:hypothetical protein FQA39_LY18063 [Lamprigera yunnana]|nr:hypothetical protein FQA39_LY18063 [Lamprigera yunnana]
MNEVELEVCANCKREIPHYNYVMHTAHCARNISLCKICKNPIPKGQYEQHIKTCKVEDAPKQMQKLADTDKTLRSAHLAINLLVCQFCELELPKLDLIEHENYCGARTEKCEECGEMVMFKYRQLHRDTNHGVLNPEVKEMPRRRPPTFDFEYTSPYTYNENLLRSTTNNGEKLETSREISRRLDCKTEYIRNLLHDSASITAPIRSTGAIPRYRGVPDSPRYRNPPTELVIPCEFCSLPVPHEDLIEHETGCRPDLARYDLRHNQNSSNFFTRPEPSSPDVELPCEFCADLIPASQLLSHQATCN